MSDLTPHWRRLCAGKQEGLAALFRAYYSEMYHYALGMLNDEASAKDAVQQLFLKLWEKHANLPSEAPPKPYLFRALRFALVDELRLRQRTKMVDLSGTASVFAWHPSVQYEPETKLRQAIQQLSATQQEIIFLRFYNQLSYSEIAEITSLQYQSVRNAAHRAIKKLRTFLKKDDFS
ncbi:MAG: RNA polymerase sigma factor [Bacteroidota bacterium]